MTVPDATGRSAEDDPPDPGPTPDPGPEPPAASRRVPRVLALLVGLSAVLVALAGAALAVQRGEVLPGTRVGPVAVGGLGEQDLRARLQERLLPAYDAAVVLRAPGEPEVQVRVRPAQAGLQVDLDATVRRALDAGRGSVPGRLWSLVRSEVLSARAEVDPVARLDEAALAQQVGRTAVAVDAGVVPGGLSVDPATSQVEAVLPRAGRRLDVPATTALLREVLLTRPGAVRDLPVALDPPPSTAAQVRALAERARALLAGPVVLAGVPAGPDPLAGDLRVPVPPAVLAPLLRTPQVPGVGPDLALDEPAAAAALEPLLRDVRRPASDATLALPAPVPLLTAQGDARFTARPVPVSLQPDVVGLEVRTQDAVAALATAVRSGSSTAGLPVRVVPPEVPAQALAGVRQVIGSFTTRFPCCAPRATNIARMAEIVDGTVVPPGGEFSLNGVAGERTRERGFVADGAIVDGELVDEVGGGVSQFSTTLYNAVWFAGLPVLEATPHSRYIGRYPPGREATLYYGSIDNRWRNDTAAPVVVRAAATRTSVTVTLYGDTGDRTVVSDTGAREPREDGGFRITWSRRVLDGGTQVRRDDASWTYAPPLE